MKKFLILSLLIIISSAAIAQPRNTTRRGDVKITYTGDVQSLIDRHAIFLSEVKTVDGYRIQILSTPRLPEADNLRARFVTQFPEHTAHIDFISPNYRLKIGDYTSRVEAFIQLQKIRTVYPDAFIVKDKVRLTDQ